jgi:transcriptional regulator with XRE-family HTH domain
LLFIEFLNHSTNFTDCQQFVLFQSSTNLIVAKQATTSTAEKLGQHLAKQLGARIALRRRERGWTQADLAEKLQVETETVSRFERGHAMPSLKRLALTAHVLDVALGDLVGGASQLAGDTASELMEILKEVTPRQRMVLLEVVRVVAAEYVDTKS